MCAINISNKRQLMWDTSLIDKIENVEVKLHTPKRQNIAFHANAIWEKVYFCYMSTAKVGDTYRIYYRSQGLFLHDNEDDKNFSDADKQALKNGFICVIESKDGINFSRPNIGKYSVCGSTDNNIIFKPDKFLDSFSVYYDENPDCPEDEKFKALCSYGQMENHEKLVLDYYKSADGYNFEFVRTLDIYGAFDTLNLIIWDKKIKKYRIYFRSFHLQDGLDFDVYDWNIRGGALRDIRTVESADMIHFTPPKRLTYDDGDGDLQLYTNGITNYHRADIIFGTPTRYYDRKDDIHNCKYLPSANGLREHLMSIEQRFGSAVTDAAFMTSYDGYHFNRSQEAFLSPGPENGDNWFYGDCYLSRGVFETPSPFPGEPNELSVYSATGKGGVGKKAVTRYTLRLDGFYSWNAKRSGGTVLTKPFTFSGGKLSVNFRTSAFGSLRIKICDENGKPIEGYDSGNLFGDSVDRPVDFEKELSSLSGIPVRFEISLSDCDLYSFIVE